MASKNFSLVDLFEQAFGYRSQAFEPEFTQVTGYNRGDRFDSGARGAQFYKANPHFKGEYFLPVTISYAEADTQKPDTYYDLEGEIINVPGETVKGETISWDLPFPVVSVTSKKTIIETPLTERRGTVKELINIEDYEITIKGLIINKDNQYPEADVTKLRNLYEQNRPFSLSNAITDIFLLRPDRSGSDEVVIKELKLPEVRGVKNVWAYELVCVSDEPFSLYKI